MVTYERGESALIYLIKSAKGYWLARGHGYTKDVTKAGWFTSGESQQHNLDRCTLYRDREAEAEPSQESTL